MRHGQRLLKHGYTDVADADLSDYFDSIPHAEPMCRVARRVCDRHLLRLIEHWLWVGVEEQDRETKRGIPQAAPTATGQPPYAFAAALARRVVHR